MGKFSYHIGEIGRKLVRWSQRDSNCLKHAQTEWEIAFPERDDMQDAIGENIFDMVAMFSLAEHSGFSASYAQNYIQAALKFKPFSPLTGDETEWNEVSFNVQQNKRYSSVFRDEDGRAYDIDGRVFTDSSGASYTNRDSRVYIEFPYAPQTEYVQVGGDT